MGEGGQKIRNPSYETHNTFVLIEKLLNGVGELFVLVTSSFFLCGCVAKFPSVRLSPVSHPLGRKRAF